MKKILNFLVAIFWLLGVIAVFAILVVGINAIVLLVAFPGENVWMVYPNPWVCLALLVLAPPLFIGSFFEKGLRCWRRIWRQITRREEAF